MVLSSTSITVGTNIASFFSRTPTLLAMGALTINEMSGGRFVLGVGPGGTQIIGDGHGVDFERPLRRARESVDIIRALLTGGRLNYEGEIFHIRRNFRLRLSPDEASIPLFMSAINPRMLELAGELADGVILTHLPLEAIPDVKLHVARGADRAGRDASSVRILANLPVGVDDPRAIVAFRRSVSLYLASETFDWLVGHTEWGELRARIRDLWWEGDRDEAAKLASDPFLESFGLGFREDTILARSRLYLEAGVVPIFYPYGLRKGAEEIDLEHLVDLGASLAP
jgi:alkanesulfonate monooxygenase SsuD/methylene tetrahydromethanopterin reductase-like flavin-dependent oxidoreductase (luciferase family)